MKNTIQMTPVKVDNKWVEECTVAQDPTVEEAEKKLITQTQQDTLQWCLDEVVGKNEYPKDSDNELQRNWKEGRNMLKQIQRQTIKKKMEDK